MKQNRLTINDNAQKIYLNYCKDKCGWEKSKIASEALIIGIQVLNGLETKLKALKKSEEKKAIKKYSDELIKSIIKRRNENEN